MYRVIEPLRLFEQNASRDLSVKIPGKSKMSYGFLMWCVSLRVHARFACVSYAFNTAMIEKCLCVRFNKLHLKG